MKRIAVTLALLALATTAASADVILTGIIDGASSSPKGVELYLTESTDLTGWALQIDANGGDDWYNGITFDATYGPGYLYVTSTSSDMISTFTSATEANTIADGSFNQNGNDAIRLLNASSTVIDQIASTSGDSIYLDSYLYRKDGTGPDGGWTEANWDIPGNDYLDTHGNSAAPFGTYVVPEPATMSLLAAGGLIALARRRRK